MDFTIVIPAFNEGQRLPRLLQALPQTLGTAHTWEIIIVEDGSTKEQIQSIDQHLSPLSLKFNHLKFKHLVLEKNQGKGAAIATGLKQSSCDIVGFMDADGATSLNSIIEMYSKMASDASLDGVMGSRIKMLGRKVERDGARHYMGRIFATYFNFLFDIPAYDTQCGAKVYRRDKILPLIDQVSDKGFVWDTQLLVLMYRQGLKILEHPVDWIEIGQNKVSMLRDPLKMALNLWRFSRQLKRNR